MSLLNGSRWRTKSKKKNFKELLYEASLYAFGKILVKYKASAQASILREVGKDILEYLRRQGFDFEESGALEDDLKGAINLFVDNGFVKEVKAEPADRGFKYTWIGLYGAQAYEELQAVTANPFLSCPLNAVLYAIAYKHNKILKLIEKTFDLRNDIVVSQEELVDIDSAQDIEGAEPDQLVIETARLYTSVEQRAAKLSKEIKKLKILLPICSHCKRIRDDEGYWNEIETYFLKYSEIKISHSLCPECLAKLYPEHSEKISREDE